MSEPALAPRSPFVGLVATWATALVIALLLGIFVPAGQTMRWFLIGFGVCVLVSFAVQLVRAEVPGFILRLAAGALGALVVMGVVSIGFGIGALFAF